MRIIIVSMLALSSAVGCATTGGDLSGFTEDDRQAFGACEYSASPGAQTWTCGGERLVEARVGVGLGDPAGARDALGLAHAELARPEFSKTDVANLGGERVRLTMLGFGPSIRSDNGAASPGRIALLVTELDEDRGSYLACVVPGSPDQMGSGASLDGVRWCHARLGALRRALGGRHGG